MCRLFALHAGTPVRATFWLLGAPDSLLLQSHREPDGTGVGIFTTEGKPELYKRPIAAWQDREFATLARELTSSVFLAHVRYASTGGLTALNTHPFSQDGRLFAHNGAVEGLDLLDRRLEDMGAGSLVQGDTDSERLFALITAETTARRGDIEAGLVAALTWTATNIPVYSLNLILATPHQLWAVRYPETNELWVLQREKQARRGGLDARTARIGAVSPDLAERTAAVVASEPMDDDPRWRPLAPGELIRIDADHTLTSSHPLPSELTFPLKFTDLGPMATSSQASTNG
ncbi:glutamine amidotransferase [Nakamurella sp. UYEF19]|uniref:class II glutamine amidotransferase n=1 Tax=Nakamurella sp. UYEF19 TaxID=1756392 RepID=UPI00339824EF